MKSSPLFDLKRFSKNGYYYRHVETIIYAKPYAICKAKKKEIEANGLEHFEFLKIDKNA